MMISGIMDPVKTKETVESEKSEVLLSVKDLKMHFPIKGGLLGRTQGFVKAVDGVTFDIFKGETFGLVGESGCGKSTAGRTIMRLYEASGGEVTFNGEN